MHSAISTALIFAGGYLLGDRIRLGLHFTLFKAKLDAEAQVKMLARSLKELYAEMDARAKRHFAEAQAQDPQPAPYSRSNGWQIHTSNRTAASVEAMRTQAAADLNAPKVQP